MQHIGHGQRTPCSAAEALSMARSSDPEPTTGVDAADPLGLAVGDHVCVIPDDYGRVPVTGMLYSLSRHAVSISRDDDRAGHVVVHFPRGGYRIERVER